MRDTVNEVNATSEQPITSEFYSIPPFPLPVSLNGPALPVRGRCEETSTSHPEPPITVTATSTEDNLTPPELPSRPRSQPKYANLPVPEAVQSRAPSPAPCSDEIHPSYAIPPVPKPAEGGFELKVEPSRASPSPSCVSTHRKSPALNGPANFNTIDTLLIKQVAKSLSRVAPSEKIYHILDRDGRKVFRASRQRRLGPLSAFTIKIAEWGMEKEFIRIDGSSSCACCQLPFCLQHISIESPPGKFLGTVEQRWSRQLKYAVRDASGRSILRIRGTVPEMTISNRDNSVKLGKISTKWSGLCKDTFTEDDKYFGVSFPGNLDMGLKSLLLAAAMLMDRRFYHAAASSSSR